jgi:GT2 family glycosyltransferase
LLKVHEAVPQAKVAYFLIIDRPGADLQELERLREKRTDISLLKNKTRLGAPGTRNRGLDSGGSELVLFLDDDVVPSPTLLAEYASAVCRHPTSPGYVGVTKFPEAHDEFSKGIIASDILTFFGLAEKSQYMPWGVTANLCLRRSSLGDIRFSTSFPPKGGGEDIDLCLRLVKRAGKTLVSVPNAYVEHPWWTDGRGSYRRFFRWSYGDSRLPALHPQHRYWNAPTLPESLLLICAMWLLVPAFHVEVGLAACLVFISVELVSDYSKLWSRGRRPSIRTSCESSAIRVVNDLGRLFGNLSRGRVWGLLERFDYFCDGVHVGGERRVAIAKFAISTTLATLIAWVRA